MHIGPGDDPGQVEDPHARRTAAPAGRSARAAAGRPGQRALGDGHRRSLAAAAAAPGGDASQLVPVVHGRRAAARRDHRGFQVGRPSTGLTAACTAARSSALQHPGHRRPVVGVVGVQPDPAVAGPVVARDRVPDLRERPAVRGEQPLGGERGARGPAVHPHRRAAAAALRAAWYSAAASAAAATDAVARPVTSNADGSTVRGPGHGESAAAASAAPPAIAQICAARSPRAVVCCVMLNDSGRDWTR